MWKPRRGYAQRFGEPTTGALSLTDAEVRKLLTTIREPRDVALISLAIAVGARREDLVAIRRSGWIVQGDTVAVTYEERKKHGKPHTAFINREDAIHVERYLRSLPEGRDASPWLFPGSDRGQGTAGHLAGRTAWEILQRSLKVVGIAPRPFHALRATCIKRHQALGWAVEKTARHVDDSVRTIERHYTTPSLGEMREAASEGAVLP